MALLSAVVAKGTHAARPAAGSAGVLYYETDTYCLFRDNGTTWDQVAGASTPAAVRATNSTNQSVSNTTATALTFNTTAYDQGAASAQHSTSSNTNRLTCQVAGVYVFSGFAAFAANATGFRLLQVRLNGTTWLAAQDTNAPSGADGAQLGVQDQYALALADYVELLAYHSAGTALNVSGATLAMTRIA